MKKIFFKYLDKARKESLTDWNWFECMLSFKKDNKKTGIHKSVFKKWCEEYKTSTWNSIRYDIIKQMYNGTR